MSGKTGSTRKLDSRVKHTRDALGDALLALMREKPFESITVQEILDRAGIGRSTFYSHYRDKDDLFLSDLEDFLEIMSTLLLRRKENSNRIVPVREMFTHVAEARHMHTLLIAADKQRDFLELGHGYFARAIELRLAELPQTAAFAGFRRAALAQAFAGAFLSLLSWWLNQTSPPPPAEMDEMFHQMFWSGVRTEPGEPDSNIAHKGRRPSP
jgi:AcrR family transcriptional regulator